MTNVDIPRHILKGWAVVVVDDDPSSLNIASMLLDFYGAKVHKAKNGEEGLALIQQIHPDLVITDLSMPVMDGWELIRRLKEDRTTLGIPIVALTANKLIGHRTQAIALGCHNFLTKPLTPYTFVKDLLMLLVDIPDVALRLQSETR